VRAPPAPLLLQCFPGMDISSLKQGKSIIHASMFECINVIRKRKIRVVCYSYNLLWESKTPSASCNPGSNRSIILLQQLRASFCNLPITSHEFLVACMVLCARYSHAAKGNGYHWLITFPDGRVSHGIDCFHALSELSARAKVCSLGSLRRCVICCALCVCVSPFPPAAAVVWKAGVGIHPSSRSYSCYSPLLG